MIDLRGFLSFWRVNFPEQFSLSREAALSQIGERERGQLNVSATDAEMASYQDYVSQVYGAYEGEQFQLATMRHIIGLVESLPDQAHIVSLGCGPASYELWLATQTDHRFTLVDYSPGMLNRAKEIATTVGVVDRVTMIQSDAGHVPAVQTQSADLVLCLNSMHWSANWRKWVEEAARIVKRGSYGLFTCTLQTRRSKISSEALDKVFSSYFDDQGAGLLVPPVDVGGGQMAISSRYYAIGRRLDRAEERRRKR